MKRFQFIATLFAPLIALACAPFKKKDKWNYLYYSEPKPIKVDYGMLSNVECIYTLQSYVRDETTKEMVVYLSTDNGESWTEIRRYKPRTPKQI